MKELKELREKLFKRSEELHQTMNVDLGATAAPGYMVRCALEDITRRPVNEEYFRQLAPEYNAFAEKIRSLLAAAPEFDRGIPISNEKLWLWGGPTPEWGGSMQPDTLVQTAQYFNTQNGVYVYGRTSEEMIALHAGMKNLLAMVTSTCRAPGQQPETDAECAEKLSRLSLKYPNIRGGIKNGYRIAKSLMVFQLLYRFVSPVIATPIANHISNKVREKKEGDKGNLTV